jgi:outer membrane protein TolC
MKSARLNQLACLLGRRLRTWALQAAWPALALGCVNIDQFLPPPTPTAPAHQSAEPAPKPVPPSRAEATAAPTAASARPIADKVLPIDLDTVLHLAEAQNVQVALAREKLHESEAEQSLADLSWLPDIHAGTAYYRHEGGIQNEDGTITHSSFGSMLAGVDLAGRLDLRNSAYQRINAERKVWQQKGELSRVTSETLMDAANTYIDLLTARTSEALIQRSEKYQNEVLERTEKLARELPAFKPQLEAIKAQAAVRRQALVQLCQQGDAAAAKLAYLLDLGPHVQLVPMDAALRPVELVDAAQPTAALVDQALRAGPGVRELEQMLNVIQSGMDRASGLGRLLPVFETRVLEGAYGAGHNATLEWANRCDIALQARWNLTDLFTASDRKRLASSRLRQAHLNYADLRGRLTLGVQEAQQSALSSREQLRLGTIQVGHAYESYQLSFKRLVEPVEGASATEVISAIQLLESAHLNSLSAIRAHNKAQVRLLVLLGATAGPPDAAHSAPCHHK